jgi:hypothetical protein
VAFDILFDYVFVTLIFLLEEVILLQVTVITIRCRTSNGTIVMNEDALLLRNVLKVLTGDHDGSAFTTIIGLSSFFIMATIPMSY